MNFPSEKFTCSKCGNLHKFETYLEFPLPENISAISSGKTPGKLKVISKNIYAINSDIYVLAKLEININNYHDALEIYNWVYVKKEEAKNIVGQFKNKSISEPIMEGKMIYPIPFYGMSNYPVVRFNLNELLVELAISTSELYQDWKNGISIDKLKAFSEYLNHL